MADEQPRKTAKRNGERHHIQIFGCKPKRKQKTKNAIAQYVNCSWSSVIPLNKLAKFGVTFGWKLLVGN